MNHIPISCELMFGFTIRVHLNGIMVCNGYVGSAVDILNTFILDKS